MWFLQDTVQHSHRRSNKNNGQQINENRLQVDEIKLHYSTTNYACISMKKSVLCRITPNIPLSPTRDAHYYTSIQKHSWGRQLPSMHCAHIVKLLIHYVRLWYFCCLTFSCFERQCFLMLIFKLGCVKTWWLTCHGNHKEIIIVMGIITQKNHLGISVRLNCSTLSRTFS